MSLFFSKKKEYLYVRLNFSQETIFLRKDMWTNYGSIPNCVQISLIRKKMILAWRNFKVDHRIWIGFKPWITYLFMVGEMHSFKEESKVFVA